MQFSEARKKERLFFDGAMGTMLQASGLPLGMKPEVYGYQTPDAVSTIHRAYIEAGCRILKTNTFGANRIKLGECGHSVSEIVRSAVKSARDAAQNAEKEIYVALDIGPTGKLLAPLGDLPFEECVSVFSEIVKAGKEAGVDLILGETFSQPYEVKALILAVKENTDLPFFLSVTADADGRMLTGLPAEAMASLAEAMGVDSFGLNCSVGPDQMIKTAEAIASATELPLFFNPNAGLPILQNGETVYGTTPHAFAEALVPLASLAPILGGCCGTTPAHLAETVKTISAIPMPSLRTSDRCVVCSGSNSIDLSVRPVTIGERINPTGKSKMKEALRTGNLDYLISEGIREEEEGADILDVNVGIPGINEAEVMRQVTQDLQTSVSLPLQIDSSDPKALEAALRIVNGRPLLNSVSGKEEVLASVLPLAKKYGAVLVGLTLDDAGIPDTAEGRLTIADKIISRAKQIGISERDLLIDTLTMAISAGGKPEATLDAIRALKQRNIKTVLGVSNISFGLPEREQVNTAFLASAMAAGLSAAILNPHSEAMMNTFRSSLALFGGDPNCLSYIAHFGNIANAKAVKTEPVSGEATLSSAIIHGQKNLAATLASQSISGGTDPLSLISNILIPTLDSVGKRFETGEVFLPQLLLSADAAEAAFAEAKKILSQSSGEKKQRGKIVLATVHGDIHDIGKNIVRVLLDSYGFEVIDLGRDVPPEKVLDAVRKENVSLVGLSALMTTTVPAMEKTIALLKEKTPNVRIMVGGAVLTESVAKNIGADRYSPDAMASVRYAEEILG